LKFEPQGFHLNSSFPLYTFLGGLIPALVLYDFNWTEVPLSALGVPVLFSLGVVLIALVVFFPLFRDIHKTGIFVLVFTALFFSYGSVDSKIPSIGFQGFWVPAVYKHLILFLVFFLFPIFFFWYRLKNVLKPIKGLTRALNLMFLSLFIICLLPIFKTRMETGRFFDSSSTLSSSGSISDVSKNEELKRDIYYIILDGYAGFQTLERLYGFSNTEFTRFLESRNFLVSDSSRGNYPHTVISLASSLNMRYLEGENRNAIDLMKDHEVLRFLKAKGYKLLHLTSGFYYPLSDNPYSDAVFKKSHFDEFFIVFLKLTVLSRLVDVLVAEDLRQSVNYAFEKLPEIPLDENPTFTFAYFAIPHPPFVFKAEGGAVSDMDLVWKGNAWQRKEHYLNQLRYTNRKVVEAIDQILKRSKQAPIVVLQSDHGPSSAWRGENLPDLTLVSNDLKETLVGERMTILNAYHLPQGGEAALYDSISPVNSFRLIFNRYFNAEYEMLEDRSFWVEADDRSIDVTESINHYLRGK